ncbi:MAG: hypothetical protein R2728_04440 [Chitinophagales bacterium]
MDVETLANHITKLGKQYFDKACNVVLSEVLSLIPINIDGSYDGGTDIVSINDGQREKVVYQITTCEDRHQTKLTEMLRKAVDKLSVQKFYFLTTYNLTEIDQVLIQTEISKELGITAICFSPKSLPV